MKKAATGVTAFTESLISNDSMKYDEFFAVLQTRNRYLFFALIAACAAARRATGTRNGEQET